MVLRSVLLLCIIFVLLSLALALAKFEIEVKSIKCSVNPTFVWDYGCRVRAARGKLGLVTLYINVSKPIPYVFSQFTLFYMYGTIYRPYLLDLNDINNCDGYKSQRTMNKNGFNTVMMSYIRTFKPELINDCPFQGYVGGVDMDLNATLAQVMPPILPRGQYKFFGRFYTEKNVTILQYETVVSFRPNRQNLLVDFSMG